MEEDPEPHTKTGQMTPKLAHKLMNKAKVHAEAAPEESIEVEIERMRARLRANYAYVISPTNKYLQRWDLTTMVGLVFTALATPVEVGFTSAQLGWGDGVFLVNRTVDLIFITDLFLQFNLAYRDSTKGGQMVKSRKLIARRYIRGWFTIDLISVIPFEVFNVPPQMKMVRLIRLLRLLKLARILKASRLLTRYETQISISYSMRDILRFTFSLIIMAHWLACGWGLVDTLERTGPRDTETITWATQCGKFDGSDLKIHSVQDRYIVSLYFVMYMITSIGFGDISATNRLEFYMCTLMMTLASIFWAYVIGNFCSIVSTSDVFGIEFKQRMDELNHMMVERNFDEDLKRRCRLFYIESKQTKRILNYRRLETEMSLQMRGEVAVANNVAWMQKLWFFKVCADAFVIEISQRMVPLVFAPMEVLKLSRTLFVLGRGICAAKGMPMAKGSVWGADFVLDDASLCDPVSASALTYAEVITLTYDDLQAVLSNPEYEEERAMVRKASVYYSLRGRLIAQGKALKESFDVDEIEQILGLTKPTVGSPKMMLANTKGSARHSFARLVRSNVMSGSAKRNGGLPPISGDGGEDETQQKIAAIEDRLQRMQEGFDFKLNRILDAVQKGFAANGTTLNLEMGSPQGSHRSPAKSPAASEPSPKFAA